MDWVDLQLDRGARLVPGLAPLRYLIRTPVGRRRDVAPGLLRAWGPPARPRFRAPVGLVQYSGDRCFGHPNENRRALLPWVEAAFQHGARLVMTAEASSTGYAHPDRGVWHHEAGRSVTIYDGYPVTSWSAHDVAEEVQTGPGIRFWGPVAQRYGGWIVYSLIRKQGERMFNALAVAGPDGRVATWYDKRHPSPQDMFASAGSSFPTLDTPFGRFAFFICADTYEGVANLPSEVLQADAWLVGTSWQPPTESHAPFLLPQVHYQRVALRFDKDLLVADGDHSNGTGWYRPRCIRPVRGPLKLDVPGLIVVDPARANEAGGVVAPAPAAPAPVEPVADAATPLRT
ncbi:MAG TPA: carbon-nitrogen hydrolase family protein [Myxococcales bacterium LLY-WYZ-16_1]|nr:carbon-nitrogen hydrolase family protein [Myxococcales bacterium LLY-WYZ-16_1]